MLPYHKWFLGKGLCHVRRPLILIVCAHPPEIAVLPASLETFTSPSSRLKLSRLIVWVPSAGEGVGAGMLVLSRKRDERIVIGDNIVITIVDVRGDKVRVGIEAPAHVPVHRQEVADALKRNAPSTPPAADSPRS